MKTLLISILLSLAFYGCGEEPENKSLLKNCTVIKDKKTNVTIIACPDGTRSEITNGQNGINGQDGTDGTDGINGQDGTDGTDGINGQNGKNGSSCTASKNGAVTTLICGNTTTYIYDGVDGTDGVDGQDGEDSKLDIIKFCPHVEDIYPTSFPEYGICIKNKIYAIYNDNEKGTFLTYLSPGQYTTTTPYENCTFGVMEKRCEIKEL